MSSITGVLLCGGAGRRFDGRDKPLIDLHDRTLAAHVLKRLTPQVDKVLISANRNLDAYRAFGHPVVVDRHADQGPLAGIEAAASSCTAELMFTCPGDSPLLPTDLVVRMRPLLTGAVDVVVPNDGVRMQHLFMLVRRTAALTIGSYLEQGGRSVHGWLDELTSAELEVLEPGAFLNINSPDDLECAENSRLAF